MWRSSGSSMPSLPWLVVSHILGSMVLLNRSGNNDMLTLVNPGCITNVFCIHVKEKNSNGSWIKMSARKCLWKWVINYAREAHTKVLISGMVFEAIGHFSFLKDVYMACFLLSFYIYFYFCKRHCINYIAWKTRAHMTTVRTLKLHNIARVKANLLERKKDILTSFKRPKWPIRPNKRLHLKCGLVNKSK